MRVVVTGDRNWGLRGDGISGLECGLILDRISQIPKGSLLIHGNCRGADQMAGALCNKYGLQEWIFPAKEYGPWPQCGPIRNRAMLDQNPDLVIAFHSDLENSKGTLDCVTEAKRRGIPVELISARKENDG